MNALYLGALPWWGINSFLIALLGALAASLGVAKAYLEWKKAHGMGPLRDRAFKQAIHELVVWLNIHRISLHAKRALVLRIENEGDIYRPEGRKFISIIYESFTHPMQSAYKDFQRYPIDDTYNEMLSALLREKYVRLWADELEGFLGDYYKSRGISFSEIATLYESKSRLIFVTFNFRETDQVDPSTPAHRAAFDAAVYRLRQYFERDPSLGD